MQGTQLRYVIKFVADMNKAVKFYRDVLGLQLKFESSGWSEFVTGETTLALHPASDKNPAGKVELGFTVADVEALLPRHERERRALRHAAKEAGFRWRAGAVRRFRWGTLQCWSRGGVGGRSQVRKAAGCEKQGAALDVLLVGEMDDPQPRGGEVRIHLAFSGVNPGDVKKRQNAFGVGMPPYPRVIPHSDGSGTVDAVGEGVSREWIGRRAWVLRRSKLPCFRNRRRVHQCSFGASG